MVQRKFNSKSEGISYEALYSWIFRLESSFTHVPLQNIVGSELPEVDFNCHSVFSQPFIYLVVFTHTSRFKMSGSFDEWGHGKTVFSATICYTIIFIA